jgi:DNA helicase-2/ATP-dependent DNA helicase PcrA
MNIILGPPGTGKTTRLLTLVEQYMEAGVPPERIGYFSFTRRAAQEAVSRACLRFKMGERGFPYFRTLHSLAYHQLGLGKSSIMTGRHYREVGEWLKIGGFSDGMTLPEGPFADFGFGDKFLEIINISRICQTPLREVYNGSSVPLRTDWSRVDYVDRGLKAYKKDNSVYDYTDTLEMFIERDVAPKLEVVLIDEVQDLSPLQWKMVHSIISKAKTVYIAGDDDQAIYRWAGADVDYFVRLEGSVEVLGQSYRIPSSHHIISQKVINRIFNRRQKDFKPREEEGDVQWHRHSEEVDLSQGDWLLLSRTRKGSNNLEQEVRQRGYLYSYNASNSIESEVVDAVRNWSDLRDGKKLRASEVKRVYKYMALNTEVAFGHKTLPGVDDMKLLGIDDLLLDHGLLHTRPWEESLTKIPESDRRYLQICLRNNESFTEKPRIVISTIHGAKGGEATNVVLLTDGIRRNNSLWKKNIYDEDDEARVFYVGLTRAKKSLHLIHPMVSKGYDIPH